MISLTRLNGERIGINPDLIERAEETPDTVLTLTNGTRYVVHETLDELIAKVQVYRAGILAIARRMADDPEADGAPRLTLVRGEPPVEPAAPPGAPAGVPGAGHAAAGAQEAGLALAGAGGSSAGPDAPGEGAGGSRSEAVSESPTAGPAVPVEGPGR